MSQPSSWPLPSGSSRLLLPQPLIEQLSQHPLARQLYPVAYGHYLEASGHRVRRTVHTDHLMIFCHAGKGHFRTREQHGTVCAGQVLFLPRGIPHSYHADSKNPWSIYWAHFAGSEVEQFINYLGMNPESINKTERARNTVSVVLTLSNWRALLPDVTELLNLQHQRLTVEKGILAANLLQKLLVSLPVLRKIHQSSDQGLNMEALDRFMRDNSHRALTLDDFAEFSRLSRFYFSKRFRHLTGTSPIRYFNQMKIEQAKKLLQETSQTVRQISQTVGFDDPYYFSRLFKQKTGIAPKYWRQRNGKQYAA